MLTRAAGPAGNFAPGQAVDVDDQTGAAFVAGGYAVALAEPPAPVVRIAEPIELAEAPAAPERAVVPHPKGKTKR